jgi:hypothetical protein
MKQWLILLAVVLCLGFASRAIAGSVDVDLDSDCSDPNRNTNPISATADTVTIWLTSNVNQYTGSYTVALYQGKTFVGSVCPSFTACGDPAQWYYAFVSFLSLGAPTGQVKVVVWEGCSPDRGKIVGSQTVTLN